MELSDGQRVAVDQLRRVAKTARSAVRIVAVGEGPDARSFLRVKVTVDCRHYPKVDQGLPLHNREGFILAIPDDFPYKPPSVYTPHTRFLGFPHVQWGRHLCLYVSEETQWNPSRGMFGFMEQLDEWLRRGARNELDDPEGPLHPPVAYPVSTTSICVSANTPKRNMWPWFGYAELKRLKPDLLEVDGWGVMPLNDQLVAPVVLLDFELPFEYPPTVDGLLRQIEKRGLPAVRLIAQLMLAAERTPQGESLYVGIGTPSRGVAGDVTQRRQHLAFWEVECGDVETLRIASVACQVSRHYSGRETPQHLQTLVDSWFKGLFNWRRRARVRWCWVFENRPEIVTPRDQGTPMDWFRRTRVALWGCGALGGAIAEHLVRAGVSELTLYDRGAVDPGLLVRQNFVKTDVNEPKASALRRRLLAIAPGIKIIQKIEDILKVLDRDDWDANVDVVIDATASLGVRTKLEMVLKERQRTVPIAAAMISADAQLALAVVSPPKYRFGTLDVLRRLGLAAMGRDWLSVWVDGFWTSNATEALRQPEPGCSDPTFVASHADVARLASNAANVIANALNQDGQSATGALLSQSPEDKEHRLHFAPDICWAVDGIDFRLATKAWCDMSGWIRTGARQRSPEDETGGLLFGEFDEVLGIVWISNVSGPPGDSVFSPEGFVCGTEGTQELCDGYRRRTNDIVRYIGTWHSHPVGDAVPSDTDYAGVGSIFKSTRRDGSHQLMIIVGNSSTSQQEIGAYLFERPDLTLGRDTTALRCGVRGDRVQAPSMAKLGKKIGLSLSGGGSRAIAFHLGTLRALEDLRLLDEVVLVSGVSGGSVMTGMLGYAQTDFDAIDQRATDLLRHGLVWPTLRKLASHWHKLLSQRWSRTHLMAAAMADVVGDHACDAKTRQGMSVVFNACELQTGTAFRMSNEQFGSWRFGYAPAGSLQIAQAIMASAAYPLVLPPFHWKRTFKTRDGTEREQRVVVTDGGVFENLGVSVMEPDRDQNISGVSYRPDVIIASDAGFGQMRGDALCGNWLARMRQVSSAIMRKVGDATKKRLHQYLADGRIVGFVYVGLGQVDEKVHPKVGGWIGREMVVDYKTDFNAMSEDSIEKLTGRGEAIARALVTRYLLSD